MKSFHPDAVWNELKANEAVVEEPLNPTFRIKRAPTVPVEDRDCVPIKHNYNEQFDIPDFTGIKTEYEFSRQGNIKNDVNGKPIQITVTRDRGRVDPDFKAKYKLTGKSKPWEFAEVFLPLLKDEKDKNSFAFESMMQWSSHCSHS